MTAHDFARLCGAEPYRDHYRGLCPAHKDTSPSLEIKQGDTSVLFKCWAGCRKEDILSALGLTWKDLFDKPMTKEDAVWNQIRRRIDQDRRDEAFIRQIEEEERGE